MNSNYLQNMFSLEGKVALVTGGGRGIGQVICRELARAGADIAVFPALVLLKQLDLLSQKVDKFWISLPMQLMNPVLKGNEKIMEVYGKLDIVVNNAGVCYHKDAFEATIEEWRECLDINLTGEYIVCREAARVMIDNNFKGSIINIASMSGHIVNVPQCQAAYNASKAGVIHMTKSLAIEWIDKIYELILLAPDMLPPLCLLILILSNQSLWQLGSHYSQCIAWQNQKNSVVPLFGYAVNLPAIQPVQIF